MNSVTTLHIYLYVFALSFVPVCGTHLRTYLHASCIMSDLKVLVNDTTYSFLSMLNDKLVTHKVHMTVFSCPLLLHLHVFPNWTIITPCS